jgi:hypothetical protein
MDLTKPAIAIGFEGAISDGQLNHLLGRGHVSVEGSMDALQELGRKYRLIICTYSPEAKFEEISDWITRNKGARYFTFEVTNRRPAAAYYIEKRAIKFDNWNQVLSTLFG